jgi:TonB family protein
MKCGLTSDLTSMSLAQTYRNQVAQHQNRRLLLYVLLAAGLHAVAGAALGLWHTHLRHALTQPLDQPTPIDFVYIEPSSQPVPPPPTPVKRSQTNALAGPTPTNRPPQTSTQAAAPARPSRSTASLLAPAPSAAAVPSPVSTPRPAPTTTSAPQPNSSARPATPPAISRPAGESTSPADLYSLSVESGSSAAELNPGLAPTGLQGQLNPNRSGPGASVDAAQDPWGGYLALLNRAIDQNWQRVPVSATSRTRIQFRVDQSGQLSDLRLLESSGNNQADQAALQAVEAAAPFAPLPPNAEEVLIVNFTFTQWFGNNTP